MRTEVMRNGASEPEPGTGITLVLIDGPTYMYNWVAGASIDFVMHCFRFGVSFYSVLLPRNLSNLRFVVCVFRREC